MKRIFPDPLIPMMLAAVALALLLPVQGRAASVVSGATTALIVALFFLHGARLPREALTAGLLHWRLHLAILATTYLVFPLLGLALASAMPALLPATLWTGILFLCALPSTVQSSIAFTSLAGGNVAGAVAAAAFSNLLGVLLTPVTRLLILIGNALTPGRGYRNGPFATEVELREVVDLAEARVVSWLPTSAA